MKFKNIIAISCFVVLLLNIEVNAQQPEKDISQMTREEVLEIPYEQLIEMPLDQLLKLADIVGVSLEELYEMILNKEVVSASKKKESSFEAPLSASVISYDEIVASGARTIEEALRLLPGLIVREKTNGNFDVHIRGNDNLPSKHMLVYSENSNTLVMIDGRQVFNYVHGGTFWETLPIGIEDIERIEVVRGPSSALYGPNAVSGVVNIITKRAESDKMQIHGNAEAGMQGTLRANLGFGQKLGDKFAYRITGNFQNFNRNSELLYVFKADSGKGDYISKEELAILRDKEGYLVFDPADDVDKMYPNPKLARKTAGGNAYLFYTWNDDVRADLKLGYQNSEVISSSMGDNPSSLVGRLSSTAYADFNANIKNLTLKINGLTGWQDIIRQDTGFKVNVSNFNALAEYKIELGKLELNPGISFQQAVYDDMPYLRYKGQGFLNGKKDLTSEAVSLRADYKPIDKVRLIAAIRGEKYNTHDDPYLSYQFAAMYSVSENMLVRAVYSRANRGPFLVDSYANYLWDREGRPNPGYIQFRGTKNLDLLTMDMIELGFRWKPASNIQLDVEAFQTEADNYGALYPDSVNLNLGDRPYVRMTYQNIDLSSIQRGISVAVSLVANENLVFKVHGTYQTTKVFNQIFKTQDDLVKDMLLTATLSYMQDPSRPYSDYLNPDIIEEETHEWTPNFFGGLSVNWKFFDQKAQLFASSYFTSQQNFSNKYDRYIEEEQKYMGYTISESLIHNIRLSYSFTQDLMLYVNAKNLGRNSIEFPYMDKIQPLILGGLIFRLN